MKMEVIPFTWITREQAAEFIGVAPGTIDLYTKKGKRPIGKRDYVFLKKTGTRFLRKDIVDFIIQTKIGPYALFTDITRRSAP